MIYNTAGRPLNAQDCCELQAFFERANVQSGGRGVTLRRSYRDEAGRYRTDRNVRLAQVGAVELVAGGRKLLIRDTGVEAIVEIKDRRTGLAQYSSLMIDGAYALLRTLVPHLDGSVTQENFKFSLV